VDFSIGLSVFALTRRFGRAPHRSLYVEGGEGESETHSHPGEIKNRLHDEMRLSGEATAQHLLRPNRKNWSNSKSLQADKRKETINELSICAC